MAAETPETDVDNITLIGAGTIGLSFAALHLTANPRALVTLHDPRPDLASHIAQHLPGYLLACGGDGDDDEAQAHLSRVVVAPALADAVRAADFVQEQGPETAAFKTRLWPQVERHAPAAAVFWSSTSGIPASVQGARMADPTRLAVVHPYNPPHTMPLLELVPSPATSPRTVDVTLAYWRRLGRAPVLVRKECVGFVANRLAFALFREACSLVAQDVISPRDLDEVVTSSMGPRWAVAGPFQAYAAGGGGEGLAGFLRKIGGTVQGCWDASGEDLEREGIRVGEGREWEARLVRQVDEECGVMDAGERDRRTRAVLEAAKGGMREGRTSQDGGM